MSCANSWIVMGWSPTGTLRFRRGFQLAFADMIDLESPARGACFHPALSLHCAKRAEHVVRHCKREPAVTRIDVVRGDFADASVFLQPLHDRQIAFRFLFWSLFFDVRLQGFFSARELQRRNHLRRAKLL